MSTKIDELFATLRILIADQSRDLAMAMAELANVAKERDKAVKSLKDARFMHAAGSERWKPPVNERMRELYRRLFALTDSRDNARQSLRAAEQDLAEVEIANSDLRTVNARLVADLAAAVQRADTAEELFACAGLRGRY